jgi:hypothetical protein
LSSILKEIVLTEKIYCELDRQAIDLILRAPAMLSPNLRVFPEKSGLRWQSAAATPLLPARWLTMARKRFARPKSGAKATALQTLARIAQRLKPRGACGVRRVHRHFGPREGGSLFENVPVTQRK